MNESVTEESKHDRSIMLGREELKKNNGWTLNDQKRLELEVNRARLNKEYMDKQK